MTMDKRECFGLEPLKVFIHLMAKNSRRLKFLKEDKSDVGVSTTKIHSIIQDSKGKMWFATNGVYIYDGTTLKTLLKKKGFNLIL
jgi:ligand-binding sensor domain-containing protein